MAKANVTVHIDIGEALEQVNDIGKSVAALRALPAADQHELLRVLGLHMQTSGMVHVVGMVATIIGAERMEWRGTTVGES